MAEWFASGRIVDAALLVLALEAAVLAFLLTRSAETERFKGLVPNLVAGACLLLALRTSLTGDPWFWTAGWLGCALIAHLVDLRGRIARRDADGGRR